MPRHISQTPPTPAEAAAAAASSLPAPPARPLSTLARVRQFFKLQQFDEPLGKTGEAATTVENEPKISYRRLYELALTEKVRSAWPAARLRELVLPPELTHARSSPEQDDNRPRTDGEYRSLINPFALRVTP